MNSEQLDHFRLVYECHSYAEAARRVPMSAQGLTKSIRSLERELGVCLFEPDCETGTPLPTPYAQELIEFVEVTGSNYRLLKDAFRRLDGERRHSLRLGCSLGVMGALGPDFLAGFHALRPDVDISYWEMNDRLCERGLVDGSYDLALSVMPFSDAAVGEVLFRCPVYFWVNAADPLADRSSLDWEDLSETAVALPGEGFKCYDAFLNETAKRGITPKQVFEMSEIFQLYEFASSGRGIGFTARHHLSLSAFAHDTTVAAIPFSGVFWGFGIERLHTHALTDAEHSFWSWCVSYARRLPSDPLAKELR